MRCPQCDHKQSRKAGETCKKCGYRFVLLPKEALITDYKLKQLAHKLSVNGQYPFTRTQLTIEVLRSLKVISWFTVFGWALMGVALLVIAWYMFMGNVNVVEHDLFAIMGIFALTFFIKSISYTFQRLRDSYKKKNYRKAQAEIKDYLQHHTIPNLVEGKSLLKREEDHLETHDAIQGIAPEVILVVERNDLVDALVKARFHTQNKTAIVSQLGYPKQVFAVLPRFVEAHPEIPVLVAHDASRVGLGLVEKLKKTPEWSFAAKNFQDIGLSADSFSGTSNRLPWITNKGQMILSNDHKKQLAQGNRLALDTFRPKALNSLAASAVAVGGIIALSAALASGSGGTGGGRCE